MADLYDAVFQWPSVSHGRVVVTGTFDNWSQSVLLSKTSSGFEGTVQLPWDSDVTYKFVVDGQWLVDDRLPTRYDGSGAINNIIHTPKKPELVAAAEPEPTPVVEPSQTPEVDSMPLVSPEPEVVQPVEPKSDHTLFTEPIVPVVLLLPTEQDLPSTDPVSEAADLVEPVPVTEPIPVAEPTSVIEQTPVVEPTLVTDEKPVTVDAPVAEAVAVTPVVETKTNTKPTEEKPAEERLSRDPKPRLNGVGSLKSAEQRRSRTLSGIGSIRSKIFPRLPTPTDDKSVSDNEGESKTSTLDRPKRLSFFGKLRNVIKPSPRNTAWIIGIAPLLVALFYAGIFHIDWHSVSPPAAH